MTAGISGCSHAYTCNKAQLYIYLSITAGISGCSHAHTCNKKHNRSSIYLTGVFLVIFSNTKLTLLITKWLTGNNSIIYFPTSITVLKIQYKFIKEDFHILSGQFYNCKSLHLCANILKNASLLTVLSDPNTFNLTDLINNLRMQSAIYFTIIIKNTQHITANPRTFLIKKSAPMTYISTIIMNTPITSSHIT